MMKKTAFPWIALGLGLTLLAILVQAGATVRGGPYLLPLLTLLLMNEFGLIVSLIGAGIGFSAARKPGTPRALLFAAIGCILLVLAFAWLGITLWPEGGVFK